MCRGRRERPKVLSRIVAVATKVLPVFVISWKYSGGVVYFMKHAGEDTFWSDRAKDAKKFDTREQANETMQTVGPEFQSAKVTEYKPEFWLIRKGSGEHNDHYQYFLGSNTDGEYVWTFDQREAYRFKSEEVMREVYNDIKRIHPTAHTLRD